ncbi:type II secretion system protein [bacterium]|nr:type II secretion system protein [bacterium]
MTKRFAFTLAEVLIALAIIGVVAAMTIPTFMANTAGAQFRTGFKKGITVLTQAASANYATEGYDFSGANVAYGGTKDSTTGVITANPVSTKSDATVLASTQSRVGFNTTKDDAGEMDFDMQADTQSLFHLLQGNLNMKNANEVINYEVGIPDIALDCTGKASITATIAGADGTATGKLSSEMGDRATLNNGGTANVQAVGGLADLCGGRSFANGGINQGRMLALEDGMVFTYDAGQMACTENNPCYGYIDVNGAAGPNRVISCSEGSNAYIRSYGSKMTGTDANVLATNCTVSSKDISDIYPVLFYGSTVKPASLAAKSVLYSQKSNQKAAASGS